MSVGSVRSATLDSFVQSRAPHRWRATLVHDAIHRDFAISGEIVDRVWKLGDQSPSELAMHFGVQAGPLTDQGHYFVDRLDELYVQPRPASAIPSCGLFEVCFGFGLEGYAHGLRALSSNRCFTTSHASPLIGSSACKAALRSSSAACQSGTGTASGSAAIESQSASTNSRRRSRGRSSRSAVRISAGMVPSRRKHCEPAVCSCWRRASSPVGSRQPGAEDLQRATP